MNPIIWRAESLSPVAYLSLSPSSTPHRRNGDRRFCQPEPPERSNSHFDETLCKL